MRVAENSNLKNDRILPNVSITSQSYNHQTLFNHSIDIESDSNRDSVRTRSMSLHDGLSSSLLPRNHTLNHLKQPSVSSLPDLLQHSNNDDFYSQKTSYKPSLLNTDYLLENHYNSMSLGDSYHSERSEQSKPLDFEIHTSNYASSEYNQYHSSSINNQLFSSSFSQDFNPSNIHPQSQDFYAGHSAPFRKSSLNNDRHRSTTMAQEHHNSRLQNYSPPDFYSHNQDYLFKPNSTFYSSGFKNDTQNMSPSNRNPPFFSTSHQDSPLSTFRNASTPENILYGFQSSQPKNDQQFPSYHQASRSTSFLRGSSPISHGLNSNQYDVECARTLYFGNLPNEYLLSEFLDLIRGGSIESIKHLVEKNCIFITFLDPNVASQIYDEMNNSKILFKGEEIKVGWGKPSAVSPTIQDYVMKGASRNVFLGNMESFMTPEWLKNEFERFGSIDTIKVISDKKIGFVHLTSINSAINAVNSLAREDPFSHMRLYYGKDRCASPPLADDKKHTADPTDPKDNRTVYLGGIHPDVTTKELCDVIRGGILQQIKYFPEKNIAFATFIEAEAASSFYNRGITDGLMLKNKRIKFGWGKPSPLPPTIAVQVEQGASRNVYIGLIDEFISEETLRQDFSPFGEIELINRLPEKRIAFVSFTDITYAIKAVEEIIENPFYAQFRINFGKDRCGNAIRPSKSFLVSPPSTPTNEILKN